QGKSKRASHPPKPVPNSKVRESSTAAAARQPILDVATVDATPRRLVSKEVVYGIKDVWYDMVGDMEERAPTTVEGLSQRRSRVNTLFRDRRYHLYTAVLIESEASLVRNVDSSSKFYMYPRFLQLMINAQIADLSSHNTKYTSHALTQKVFANMRKVGKGFSGVDTLLFEGMLVPQQVQVDIDAAAEDEDAAEPTPPSPTTTPPPLQQELIHSTSHVAPTLPPSLHQYPIAPPSSPSPQQPPSHDVAISMDLLNQLLETCATPTKKVGNLEQDKVAQAIEIIKLKQRVRKLEKTRKLKASGRMHQNRGKIAEIDAYEDVTLEEVAAEVAKEVAVQGRLEESQAHVYHLDLEHAQKVLIVVAATTTATTITAAPMPTASAPRRRNGVVIRDLEETVTPSVIVHSEPKFKDKGNGILVKEPKPLKKQAHIEQDEAYARELEAELNANINRNEVIDQVKRKGKQDNAVMRYQALKRKPQTKVQARKNMMVYLKNMAGFKMDCFKGITYDEMRPIFEKHFNSIVAFLEKGEKKLEEEASKKSKRKSETSKEKAAKKQKLDEEVEELKTNLQIIPNDENDVYTEATL
nr:hypothetical protein [Tanacetum cinerariifolium]